MEMPFYRELWVLSICTCICIYVYPYIYNYSFRYLSFLSSFFYFFLLFSYLHLLILVFPLSFLPCLGPLLVYFLYSLSSFFSSSLMSPFILTNISFLCCWKLAVQTELVCVVPRLWETRGHWIQYFLLHTSHLIIHWHNFTVPCCIV